MAPNRNTALVIFFSLLLSKAGIADEAPGPKEIQAGLAKHGHDYVLRNKDSETILKLHETPLLKWSNPERSEQQGVVFIWHEDGLPMAIGSFFTFEYRGLRAKHELHSLSNAPLSASYRGKAAWSPNKPGLNWKAFPGIGPPHTSKGLRLTQMKQIAGSFETTLVDPDGDRRKLRLLRTPLHRFSSRANTIVDGAIFSYTVATDPEALLVVRAKDDRWEYALARFHYWQLEARLGGRRVWTVTLDQDLQGNRLGGQLHLVKVYNSFYPEADYLFRP